MNITFICDNCGKEFGSYRCYAKRERKHRFCSKKCEADFKNYHNSTDSWIGGRIGSKDGYRYIRINGKDYLEHRLIMEMHLGRKLKKSEVVHHKNKNRADNRIENLELMTNSEHSRMHNTEKSTIRHCARCGKTRTIHGRGLCANCYHYMFLKKELDKWPLANTAQKK